MDKIIVIYHSQQYGNTKILAEALAEGARGAGAEVNLINTNERRLTLEEFLATDAPAGSRAKIDILAARVMRGEPLWHPEDRSDYSGLTGAVRPRDEAPVNADQGQRPQTQPLQLTRKTALDPCLAL